ncbi:hypothetical protein GCM10010411_17410 [Actinomadura fulvescens]|uniref:Secreted protein n=2 Tax=Actinomadura fulvescens TaxID=46160 RepID=A0ABN3PLL3_9ACTN
MRKTLESLAVLALAASSLAALGSPARAADAPATTATTSATSAAAPAAKTTVGKKVYWQKWGRWKSLPGGQKCRTYIDAIPYKRNELLFTGSVTCRKRTWAWVKLTSPRWGTVKKSGWLAAGDAHIVSKRVKNPKGRQEWRAATLAAAGQDIPSVSLVFRY